MKPKPLSVNFLIVPCDTSSILQHAAEVEKQNRAVVQTGRRTCEKKDRAVFQAREQNDPNNGSTSATTVKNAVASKGQIYEKERRGQDSLIRPGEASSSAFTFLSRPSYPKSPHWSIDAAFQASATSSPACHALPSLATLQRSVVTAPYIPYRSNSPYFDLIAVMSRSSWETTLSVTRKMPAV